MGRFSGILYYILCFIIFLYILAPLFIIILLSFNPESYLSLSISKFSIQWYKLYLSSNSWVNATFLSIGIALVVAGISTIVGTMASFSIVRGNFMGKDILQLLLLLPLLIPPVILAVGIYDVFSKWHLIGTPFGIIIAHTVLALPFVILIVSASLYQLDKSFEEVAASLGANELEIFYKVTFPIISPEVISAMLIAFIVSFDELIISLFISNYNTITLPQKIWSGLHFEINPIITAVSTVQIVFISIILIITFLIKNRWT